MRLILFRHGLAVDRDVFIEQKKDDALRPLTRRGIERTQKMAQHLQGLIGDVQLLVSSPFVRAQQTADVIAQHLDYENFVECSELVPQAPPQAFANWLKSQAAHATSVLAVGHEPHLAVFASWVLSGSASSFLDLKKSGVVILEVESFDLVGPRTAELKALLNPKFI